MSVVLGLLRERAGLLVLAVVLTVIATALELLPHAVLYVVALDVFGDPARTDRLPTLAGIAFGGVLLRYVVFGGGLMASHAATFDLMRRLRVLLLHRLTRSRTEARDGLGEGALKKTLVEDIDALEGLFAHNLPDFVSGLLVPALALGALAVVDWRLALVSISLVPVGMVLMAVTMRDIDVLFAQWHAAEARANESILEYLRGIVVLKAHDRDASSLARVRDAVHGIFDLAAGMTKRSSVGYEGFMTLLSSNLVVVLPVGVWMHRRGSIDEATLVLFLLLGFGLTAPLLKLLFLFGSFQGHAVRFERIAAVMALPLEPEGETIDLAPAAGVTVSGLGYAYDEDRGTVLEDISFQARPGTVTAVVGPSGSGKSTLLTLLAGARTPTHGSVRAGGVDLHTVPAGQRARLVTSLRQHAWLFRGTLADNIGLARVDADRAAIEAAGRAARLGPVVDRLPFGWDALVGERGATLSGGEVQRVAIARALLRDTPVLLLDEVTAHLDPQNESAVQQALSGLVANRTVVVVAHRLRTVQKADRIVVLDAGRQVGVGTHGELMENCTTYRRLWDAQEQARTWRLTGTPRAREAAS